MPHFVRLNVRLFDTFRFNITIRVSVLMSV
nr:MAG TPA: hypothetical protein [Caudoviricetes sp.]